MLKTLRGLLSLALFRLAGRVRPKEDEGIWVTGYLIKFDQPDKFGQIYNKDTQWEFDGENVVRVIRDEGDE